MKSTNCVYQIKKSLKIPCTAEPKDSKGLSFFIAIDDGCQNNNYVHPFMSENSQEHLHTTLFHGHSITASLKLNTLRSGTARNLPKPLIRRHHRHQQTVMNRAVPIYSWHQQCTANYHSLRPKEREPLCICNQYHSVMINTLILFRSRIKI